LSVTIRLCHHKVSHPFVQLIPGTTLLFFDASCLVAAAGSPHEGSGFLLSLFVRGVVSPYVLLEAERNIQARLETAGVHIYHNFVATIPYLVAAVPYPLPSYPGINAKDIHVVAAADFASFAYLLTLDKRLLAEINAAPVFLSRSHAR
jgi:hypothetical protein